MPDVHMPAIRRLTVRDAEEVLRFLEGLDDETVRLFHPHKFDFDHVLRLLRGRLSGAVDAFGAHDGGGALIGYAWLWSMETQRPGLGICVAEGHRGQGIGRALMERVLDEAVLRGKPEVSLSVVPDNERALNLYRSLGFEIVERAQGPHRDYFCMTYRSDLSPASRAQAIRRRLKDAQIRLVPYSHPDWAWVHTRHWHAHRYALVFDEALQAVARNPGFRWYCDNVACQLSALLDHRLELLPELRRQVAAGRIDVCGGYANVRPNMVGDETFVRSLVLGKRAWAETIPEAEVVVHADAVDVAVGHAQMPQLLTLGGYRYLRMWRPYGALSLKGIPNDFIWRGMDGTEIPVARGCYGGLWAFDGPSRALLDPSSADPDEVVCALWDTELESRVRYADTPLAWLAVGCDDARPNRLIDDTPFDVDGLARWWNAHETAPMSFATPTEYFAELMAHRDRLQTIEGTLDPCDVAYNAAWNGEQGLHQMRIVNDRLLVEAELFRTLAWCARRHVSDPGPSREGSSDGELTDLWKDHLLTCAHATQWLYVEDFRAMRDRADRVRLTAARLRDDAIRSVARAMDLPDDTAYLVANPLPWERDAVVEMNLSRFGDAWPVRLTDLDGHPLPHQVVHEHRGQGGYPEQRVAVRLHLPAGGITGVRQMPAADALPASAASASPRRWSGLDNGVVRLDMREGRIMAVQQSGRRRRSRSLDAPLGLEWGGIVVKEVATQEGPLHVGPIRAEHVVEWTLGEAMEDGPVRWRYRRRGQALGIPVAMDVILTLGSPRVDFEVSVDWPGLDGFMAVRFPLPVPCRMRGDIPFGVEVRDIAGEPYMKDHWVGPHSMERVRDGLFYARSFVAVEQPDGQSYAVIGRNTDRYYLRHCTGRYLEHILINSVVTLDEWEHQVEPSTLHGRGPHRFMFSLLPCFDGSSGAHRVRAAAEARSEPIVLDAVRSAPAPPPPLPSPVKGEGDLLPPSPAAGGGQGEGGIIVSPNANLTAFRLVDGAVEMRLHECCGESSTAHMGLPFEPASATLTDFLGKPMPGTVRVSGRHIELDLSPWQIVTVRLARALAG
ncbi:MAG: GNAT family N-acetyltransferase [Chthonomonadales bacterium]|nr:GNAT family N-acetyltransferase [Chthonomonadales bacterium]